MRSTFTSRPTAVAEVVGPALDRATLAIATGNREMNGQAP